MQLGMPSLIEYKTLEQSAALCKALGLDFVELNMNLPGCIPENLSSKDLMKLRKDYGVDFTVHLPEELDLSSFQPSLRKGHMNRCVEALEWASGAEITTLNMHLNNGIYFTLPDKKVWINEQYESEFIKSLCDSYFHLYNQAKPLGVRLCIENTRNFHLPFIGRALEALRGFDGFYLTWDAGHDAMADYQEEPILMQHADRIRHMHLHDFNGQSDHQTLYTGKVPINDRLQFAADNQISVVIEVKTSDCLEQSVRHIRNRFVFPNG